MHYHMAIVDDDPAAASYVDQLVHQWAGQRGHTVKAEVFPSAEAFLFQYEEDKSYAVMLLDIEMTGMDGVTLARTIRQDNETVQIIFITGFMDYIAEGYDVAALHYLVKPVKEEKLFAVLDRAESRIATQEKTLSLHTGGTVSLVPVHEIRYIDAQRNYICVHAKQDYTVRGALSDLEEKLDETFYRLGRSTILHLTEVSFVTRAEVALKDGTRIPLPRGQYDAVNRAIIQLL